MRAASAEDTREESRRQAACMFADVLDVSGLSRESAARAMGVGKSTVVRKLSSPDKPVTLADVLDLIDGATDAGEALVRRLQARVDARRGQRVPSPEMAPRVCLWVAGIVGELCVEIGTCVGTMNEERAKKTLETCAQLHAQLAKLEACVRGMGTTGERNER